MSVLFFLRWKATNRIVRAIEVHRIFTRKSGIGAKDGIGGCVAVSQREVSFVLRRAREAAGRRRRLSVQADERRSKHEDESERCIHRVDERDDVLNLYSSEVYIGSCGVNDRRLARTRPPFG
jgi:hypothetical protein